MVDNQPLEDFLKNVLKHKNTVLQGIDENIKSKFKAIAVIGTEYSSGIRWHGSRAMDKIFGIGVKSKRKRLNYLLIMSWLRQPCLFFPAVSIDDVWYGDGGIRLNALLSPAMHLGASKILAVSPRVIPNKEDSELVEEYPSPGQIAGVLLNSIFLDLLDYDALQMNRINRLLDKINQDEEEFRRVEVMVLRPKKDLENWHRNMS